MSFIVALVIYVIFLCWYKGFGTKAKQSDIDNWYQKALSTNDFDKDQLDDIKRFFEEDDGKPFVMVNALKIKAPFDESRANLAKYSKNFLGFMIKRACHPIFASRVAGDNIELIGIDKTDWHSFFLVRYRGRRDLLAGMMAIHGDDHRVKLASLEKTFACPTSIMAQVGSVPTLVGFILLSIAGIVQAII